MLINSVPVTYNLDLNAIVQQICVQWCLKEAISYYINNGSSVFCTLLDATKAFDRVEYVKLFKLLIVRDIPPVSLSLLLNMYTCHGK